MRDVMNAIYFRIGRQRMDLVKKHGIVAVNNAVQAVVEGVGEVEEIGSSDVSCWVKNVEEYLDRTPN